MTRSVDEVRDMVLEQLGSIRDSVVREGLARILVEPRQHLRTWDYDPQGQQFPCWTVAVHSSSDTSIVYSDHGFGPRSPWGLVSTKDLFFGMDSGWFATLQDCFVESFAACELSIWQVVGHARSAREETLHRDVPMDAAFQLRDALAEQNPETKYHVLPRADETAV